jgi:hypothetical protein
MTATTFPNSPETLAPPVSEGRIPMRRVWGMLALRSVASFSPQIYISSARDALQCR